MNIVLINPDIPGNTGNIGRTCVGTKNSLHLVGKLGFSLDDKHLKRSGLDYWKNLDLKVHKDWNSFLENVPKNSHLLFFEKDAEREFWDAKYAEDSCLIFGSETKGFPAQIIEQYKENFYKIPMTGPIRSLNLSSSVAVVVYEAIRQIKSQKKSHRESTDGNQKNS